MDNSNLIELYSQNKHYETHRRKIQNIMTKSTNSLSFRNAGKINNFYTIKQKAHRYSQRAKQEAIEKENDLILRKIINVNKRNPAMSGSKNHLSHNNLTNLKKKIEKTNEQNQKFAEKLVSTTSKLNQHVLGSDHKRYNEIKQRLKKYTHDDETGMIIPKKIKSLSKIKNLEPIRYDQFGQSRFQNQQNAF